MKKEYNLEESNAQDIANTVKERFSNVPGVTNVEVSLENKVATVEGATQASTHYNIPRRHKYSIKNNQPQNGRAIFRPAFLLPPQSLTPCFSAIHG